VRYIVVACMFACNSLYAATISGQVVAQGGQPLAGARVFVEPGLGGALMVETTSATGTFSFDNLPAGLLGIFAHAEGYAFGGLSQTVGPADTVSDLTITLLSPGSVGGRVINPKGDPIPGARITRVLLQGSSAVSVPLAKLTEHGFTEPQSDSEGKFSVQLLPVGFKAALKVGHTSFAQQGIGDLTVGDLNVRVQLYEGVLVRGSVIARDSGQAVSNAVIVIRAARPPHDTVLAKTDATGRFSVRLNPNTYAFQSASAELRSAGWEKLNVSGQELSQEVTLRVSGTGTIRGEVRDAKSNAPIAGARLSLSAFGSPAAVITTGASGSFEFSAVEGENTIQIEPAAGFLKPERPFLTLTVKQGETVTIPSFYLAPLPGYTVKIVDSDQTPVPGAIVRMIRPMQYRWYIAGSDGTVSLELASMPVDNKIVGMVERPASREGALFSIDMNTTREAVVQLLQLGSVTAQVMTSKQKPVEGAVVGGLFQSDADDEPLPLWRTTTGADGRFTWNHVVPYVPAACLASAGEDIYGRSISFNIDPGANQDLGRIVLVEPKQSGASKIPKVKTLLGKVLPWHTNRLQSGVLPTRDELDAGVPAVVVYTTPQEAAMVIDALEVARKTVSASDVVYAVVVDGAYTSTNGSIPVLQGAAPGSATTYLVDLSGKVILETSGLPPASALATLGTPVVQNAP